MIDRLMRRAVRTKLLVETTSKDCLGPLSSGIPYVAEFKLHYVYQHDQQGTRPWKRTAASTAPYSSHKDRLLSSKSYSWKAKIQVGAARFGKRRI